MQLALWSTIELTSRSSLEEQEATQRRQSGGGARARRSSARKQLVPSSRRCELFGFLPLPLTPSFFDREESDSEDEEAARVREANRKRVRTELERAAGGPLTET